MTTNASATSSSAWLPEGKRAAVCFTIDDIHPAKSTDRYEAGGDLGRGALRHLERLLDRHPKLKATLFVTPDWREISPVPTRTLLAKIPVVRDRLFLGPRWPAGTMQLDRHPEFVRYVRGLPRTDVGLHGLHHVHRGLRIATEFQEQSEAECRSMLRKSLALFRRADLPHASGMTPPGFNAPEPLLEAMAAEGLRWVSSARDILSPITADAKAAMTGLRGVSLVRPEILPQGLVHVPVNFQATSVIERAMAIVEASGVLSVKAHVIKNCCGFIALDGLDELYTNYLDLLFTTLEARFGDSLWWTNMDEIAQHLLGTRTHASISEAS